MDDLNPGPELPSNPDFSSEYLEQKSRSNSRTVPPIQAGVSFPSRLVLRLENHIPVVPVLRSGNQGQDATTLAVVEEEQPESESGKKWFSLRRQLKFCVMVTIFVIAIIVFLFLFHQRYNEFEKRQLLMSEGMRRRVEFEDQLMANTSRHGSLLKK